MVVLVNRLSTSYTIKRTLPGIMYVLIVCRYRSTVRGFRLRRADCRYSSSVLPNVMAAGSTSSFDVLSS